MAVVVEMHMVLVAEMLDPMHATPEVAAVWLSDLQMLGPHADSFRMARRARLGQQLRRQQIDLRHAKPGRDVNVVGRFVDLARCTQLK